MKISLLNDSFPPLIDGVANTVVNYASVLQANGHEVSVVTPRHPEENDAAYPYPVIRYPGLDVRKLTGYIAGYPFSAQVQQALIHEEPELLHSHCPFVSTMVARSAAKALRIPLVMTYHTKFDVDISRVVKLKLAQEGMLRALVDNINACDEVWTVSRGAGENLRAIGYDGDYYVMENGVDIPKGRLPEKTVQALTGNTEIPPGVPVYLFVGRMMWYKGIRMVLDALAALKSRDFDFRMVFIGKGADEEEIRQYTGLLNLTDKVIFLGPVYDREVLSAWYCRADLFLFASSYDTNGLVVREAAACSLPSVLIKGSCAAEGVTEGRNGFLVEENAASLAVCLASIQAKPEWLYEVRGHVADDLYISWEDAVLKAAERYQIVIDNYKCGRYPAHTRMTDEFYQLHGDLMEIIAKLSQREEE